MPPSSPPIRRVLLFTLVAGCFAPAVDTASAAGVDVTASTTADGADSAAVLDGDRFSTQTSRLWRATAVGAHLQFTFSQPRSVGAILQINGDHADLLQHAPQNYAWQVSDDGTTWRTLADTVVRHETRMYRIHRLSEPATARRLRLVINLAHGDAAAVREVEFYDDPAAEIPFPDWIVGVSSFEDEYTAAEALPFIRLARECQGWQQVPAQCVWHGKFNEDFVAVEPRPLCAFLSGSIQEWCQCSREPWRGVQQVLKSRKLPLWGACGGAQVLAILDETGVDHPWDCPRCRDPQNPQLPIYSHIGHTGPAPCGDYGSNIGERGLHQLRIVAADPAFAGVSDTFDIYESHVGQIEYVPDGWTRLVTKGDGAHTVNQCLRVVGAPIYAAQFHMERYTDTRDVSIRIMTNFLNEARRWREDESVPKAE